MPNHGGAGWATATRLTAYQNETVILELPAGQATPVTLFFRNPTTDHYIIVKNLIIDGMNRTNSNAVAFYNGSHHIRFEDSTIRKTASGFEAVVLIDADNIEFVSTTSTPTMTIHNAGTDGIGLYGAVDGLVLQGVNLRNNGGKGLNLSVDDGSHTNAMVNRSEIHHNGTEGIDIGPGTGAVVQNTHLYRNGAGLRIRSGASTIRIDNNNAANNFNRGSSVMPAPPTCSGGTT